MRVWFSYFHTSTLLYFEYYCINCTKNPSPRLLIDLWSLVSAVDIGIKTKLLLLLGIVFSSILQCITHSIVSGGFSSGNI